MSQAQGFWSYVHADNDGMHGAILRVAQHLQDEYGVITGGSDLDLFLDTMKLKWGDKWRDRIREAIQDSTFFIPIVTPRYFKSAECRKELLGFADEARGLGREALIMPLYFVDVPEIESGDSDDPMVELITESQMKDWRTLRVLDHDTQPYRIGLADLATELREISRDRESVTAAKPTASSDEEDEDSSGATPDVARSEHTPRNELGLLEELAEGEDAFPRLVETLNALSPELEKVGELTRQATQELHESDAQGGGFKARLSVTRRLASNLVDPVDELERRSSEYVADLLILDPAIRHMIELVSLQSEDGPEESAEFFSSIEGMIASSERAARGIIEMITSIGGVSNMSRDLDPVLQRLRSSLQSVVDNNRRMEEWQRLIEDARAS
jgi:hypothetical protein